MPTTPRDGLDTLSVGGAGTYDCHAYYNEKKRALQLLAAHIDRIMNPQDSVVPMRVRGSGMTRNVSGSHGAGPTATRTLTQSFASLVTDVRLVKRLRDGFGERTNRQLSPRVATVSNMRVPKARYPASMPRRTAIMISQRIIAGRSLDLSVQG
jgi:hypothetical protein